ncbi:MAG: hypothetical protein ACOY3Z_10700 [Thermodesulfobacteriota bacterium]
MQECAMLEQCPFLATLVGGEGELLDHFLSLYCRGDFAQCARHEAAREMGAEQVPLDLFPNEWMFGSLVALAACRQAG